MANTVDPDETAHYELSHLDLQCLQIQLLLCLALYRLIIMQLLENLPDSMYLITWCDTMLVSSTAV